MLEVVLEDIKLTFFLVQDVDVLMLEVVLALGVK